MEANWWQESILEPASYSHMLESNDFLGVLGLQLPFYFVFLVHHGISCFVVLFPVVVYGLLERLLCGLFPFL